MRMLDRTPLVLCLTLALLNAGGNGAQAQAPGTAEVRNLVSGWNLIAIPPGTTFSVAPKLVLALRADGLTYASLQSSDAPSEGQGYWVYVDGPSNMSMPAPLHDGVTVSVTAGPGEWVLIGDTTSFYPGLVTGADAVFTYDPDSGYQMQRILFPGQGAWAMTQLGGTITVGSASPSGPPPAQRDR